MGNIGMWLIFGQKGGWVTLAIGATMAAMTAASQDPILILPGGTGVAAAVILLGVRWWYKFHPYCRECGKIIKECQLDCRDKNRA